MRVLPTSNAPEMFHTFFWTPSRGGATAHRTDRDGTSIPHDVVMRYQNFHVVPYVEIEDIFVNKAVRSVQLKLRECIVTKRACDSTCPFRAVPPGGTSHHPRERVLPRAHVHEGLPVPGWPQRDSLT